MILLQKVQQHFDSTRVQNIEATIRRQFDSIEWPLHAGARVALAVGSRGIAGLTEIVRTVVDCVRARNADPFIFPAMGSHGGATADGQRNLLEAYGVSEKTVGCPVLSTMDVVEFGNDGTGIPLLIDRHAFESDSIILINRIKPHTDFHGPYESGLVKMCVIGLGKERQASLIHTHGIRGLRELVPQTAARIFRSGKIMLGLGIVENAYDQLSHLEIITADRIMEREPELLLLAKNNMPSLPLETLDILVIDRMGKDISGVGMDTNIIGRIRISEQEEPAHPKINMIVVTDLTAASHGNATGIGLADVTTRRLREKIDFEATYTNIITSSFYERGRLPIVAETDRRAFEYAWRGCRQLSEADIKVARIKDTLHLGELYLSQGALNAAGDREKLRFIGQPTNPFDENGNLQDF